MQVDKNSVKVTDKSLIEVICKRAAQEAQRICGIKSIFGISGKQQSFTQRMAQSFVKMIVNAL